MKRVSKSKERHNALYAANKAEYKAERIELDGGLCERCESVLGTDLHHKAQRHGALLWHKPMFSLLCRPCHKFIHANPSIGREEKFIIDLTQSERDAIRAIELPKLYE